MKSKNDTNPMSEYLYQIQMIVNNSEFMNKEEADEYETETSKINGTTYVNAVLEKDAFESHIYERRTVMRLAISLGYTDDQAMIFISNQLRIPLDMRDILLQMERERIIASYKELNRYFLRLSGKPFMGDFEKLPENVVAVPYGFFVIYENEHILTRDMPVHEMPSKYLELFINSEFYPQLLQDNPKSLYLNYIGSKSIPIHVSRLARDGDILRISTDKLNGSHPKMGNISVPTSTVHEFTNCYNETRDYIHNHLRGNFKSIFPNYTSFIRFLTIYMAIGQTLNELQRKSSQLIHMNKLTANDFFLLYGLPSVIMSGSDRENFLRQIRLLLADKATNIVYRVKDLIGYEYTDIHTLVMVKQQHYQQGIPIYYRDSDGNMQPKYDIYFRRMGTTYDETSYFKFRSQDRNFTVDEITSGDPRWWNSPEVDWAINDMNYTLSNSKYIQMSTHVSMSDIWWQCVILLRSLLDNKSETQFMYIQLNQNINNLSELSVFEAVLILNVLMNRYTTTANGNTMNGNLYLQNSQFLHEGDVAYEYIYPRAKERFIEENPRERSDDLKSSGDIVWRETEEEYEQRWLDNKHIYFRMLAREIGVNNVCLDLLFNSLDNNGRPENLVLGWPYKVSAFNWKIREEHPSFYRSIKKMDFIRPDIFLPLLEDILNRNVDNIGEVVMYDVKEVYKYLEDKLRTTRTISDFRQVTSVFKHLFLVEPIREDWYKDIEFDIDKILIEKWGMTQTELNGMKSLFRLNDHNGDMITHLSLEWNDEVYDINLNQVWHLNTAELTINGCQPFLYPEFRELFSNYLKTNPRPEIANSSLPSNIVINFHLIILDKIELDVGNTAYGPKTFESMLFRYNPRMYAYLNELKNSPDTMVLFMRSIIKGLEEWCNASLQMLSLSALGEDEYISILKDVISYFKSYMVEFTKSEFIYMFDGLWDQGGNSNMLRLHDEIASSTMTLLPSDSVGLHDVSRQCQCIMFMDQGKIPRDYKETVLKDSNINAHPQLFHDSIVIRYEMKYSDLLNTGYEILYDDGNHLSDNPFYIEPDMKILYMLREKNNGDGYQAIINLNNLTDGYPRGYIGNML